MPCKVEVPKVSCATVVPNVCNASLARSYVFPGGFGYGGFPGFGHSSLGLYGSGFGGFGGFGGWGRYGHGLGYGSLL